MNQLLSATLMALLLPLGACQTYAFVEVQADCENLTVGEKPEVAPPKAGAVCTKPSALYVDEAAGATVRVAVVEPLQGKAFVVADKSGDESGKQAAVGFGGVAPKDAALTGKVYAHFDWVSLSHETGNIGFALLKNSKFQPILCLMFDSTKTDITVLSGDQRTDLKSVVTMGQPVGVDVMLDLDQWRYEISLNGKKVADGALTKGEDNSFLHFEFCTATSGMTSFAVKNVIISPHPSKR